MSEYTEVEQPFLQQLETLGWSIVDQGPDIPQDPGRSLRQTFRQWILPDVFAKAVSAINKTAGGKTWLTVKQLNDLRDQILRQPSRTLLEANEAIQKLIFKAQVDVNEITGEQDPVVRLVDFETPRNNRFHAVNQFRIDTPGCVKQFIIPDIVLFVNGIPRVVVECKKGGESAAKKAFEAFYGAKGEPRIRERMNYFAPKAGVNPTGLKVRDLGYRWASCTKNNALRFNWKCMMAPAKIIDYMVVHELCHINHRNHTDAFWNEVDKVMPDHLERKMWLKKHGAGLDL